MAVTHGLWSILDIATHELRNNKYVILTDMRVIDSCALEQQNQASWLKSVTRPTLCRCGIAFPLAWSIGSAQRTQEHSRPLKVQQC